MILVAANGKKRAGKGVMSSVLQKNFDFVEVNFADSLKHMCAKALQAPVSLWYDETSVLKNGQVVYLKDLPNEQIKVKNCIEPEFAQCLRKFAPALMGLESITDQTPLSARVTAQIRGTEFARTKNQNYWVDLLAQKLQEIEAQNPNARVFISDMRFPNEFDFVEKLGGLKVRVIRPELLNKDVHPSESALDDHQFDKEFINRTGFQEEYVANVAAFFETYLDTKAYLVNQ